MGTLAIWVTAGLSMRFGWQPGVSVAVPLVALVAILIGSVFTAWAMLVNRFFSAMVRIQKDRGHAVISTGPYRIVRHPGYAGMVVFNFGTPIVLDAYWALVPAIIVVAGLILRTALEDKTLRAELAGYAGYAKRTPYRLVWGVW